MSSRRMLLNKKTSNIPPNNEIWYTSSDGDIATPYSPGQFGSNIVTNTYKNGKGIIKFIVDVKYIGNYSFCYTHNLTSIIIPNKATYIGDSAFAGCSALTSINIPESVMDIGYKSFAFCSKLTSITFEGTIEKWENITLNRTWHEDSALKTIHCTDGDINL